MGILPTNRTTSDTAATHVTDHNTLHTLADAPFWYRVIGATYDRYYFAGHPWSSTAPGGVATLAVDTMFAVPYFSGRGGTIDRIACNVSTGIASGKVRLGIYTSTSDSNPYPATLVLDSGELDASTSGVKTATVSQVLDTNALLWFVYTCGTATPGMRTVGATAFPILGSDNTMVTNMGVGWFVARAYGALPASFPGSASISTATGNTPLIGVRYSA
jgi:hypothetical protein